MKKQNSLFKTGAQAASVLLFFLLLVSIKSSGQLIAGWDFQTTASGGTATAAATSTPKVYVANVGSGTMYLDGTNGSSNWSQANELTAFAGTGLNAGGATGLTTTTTTPAALAPLGGTGLSANGKSMTFKFSMNGYKDLVVSYATQRSSGSGFTAQLWEYSTNGSTWTSIQTISPPTAFAVQTLPTITALDNAATAYLRITFTSASGVSGNNRLDNIQFNVSSFFASTDYFRSAQTGDWSSISTWESSPDGVTWASAIQTPTSSAYSVEIQSGHTVTISTNVTAQRLTIDAGGVLVHNSGAGLSIKDEGTTAYDFTINGRYEINGTIPTYSVGTEKFVVSNNAEARATGPSPSDSFARDTHGYWNTGSVFNWQYNATSSTFKTSNVGPYFPNASSTDKAIFRVTSINATGTVGANSNTIFNGKLEVTSGVTLIMQNPGTKIFRDGWGGTGILTHKNNCGPFQVTSTTAVIDGSITVEFEHSTGNDLVIPSGANVTMGGTASVNFGKSPYTQASLLVDGTFTSNGNFTFKSDVNGTARIASSAGTFIGNAVVQTYISARRSWRLLAVNTVGQTINAAWQEGATSPTIWPNVDPNPGFGTPITFTTGAPGYDVGPEQNASIKKWNLNNGWSSLPSTLAPLNNELGYFLFVRGPRSTDLRLATTSPTAPTVLRSKGTVKTGPLSILVSSSVAGGYVLIPNQYVSSLTITNAINSPNMNPSEYNRWDHGTGGVYGVGGWVSVLNGTVSNPTSRFPNATATSNVQIGESFIGKLANGATSASVSFTESDKLSTEFLVFRPIKRTVPEVHAQLFAVTDSTISNLDGVAVQFGRFTQRHSVKLTNPKENISIRIADKQYSIETKTEVVSCPDSSELELTKLNVGGKYSILVTTNESFTDSMKLFFVDRSMAKILPITKDFSYDYVADSVTYKKRFMLWYQAIDKKHEILPVNNELVVYPNPVSDILHFEVTGEEPLRNVSVTDITGRIINLPRISDHSFNCSSLAKGIYILKVGDNAREFEKQ